MAGLLPEVHFLFAGRVQPSFLTVFDSVSPHPAYIASSAAILLNFLLHRTVLVTHGDETLSLQFGACLLLDCRKFSSFGLPNYVLLSNLLRSCGRSALKLVGSHAAISLVDSESSELFSVA